MLEVRDLGVTIGPVTILQSVSFEVTDGVVQGIIGRNGAGKTTLIRSIMGLVKASGDVLLDGKSISATPPHERSRLGFGYMPEDRRLVPDFTVEENILLPVDAMRLENHADRLEWIYQHMPEIAQFRRRLALELSGGQQKMVALGRALMAGRRMLLLDEPFEGLAPALSHRIGEILAGLKKEGVTIVVAESYELHLKGLMTHACRIERGRVSVQ